MCTALAEDDVARNDELGCSLFGTETFAGPLGAFVGAALGGGGAGANEGKGEEWRGPQAEGEA